MKKNQSRYSIFVWCFLLLLILVAFFGCSDKCQLTNSYVYYEPVYSTTAEIRSAVGYLSPRTINDPGRIYFKDDVIYVNEIGKGIHVINNENPLQPTPLGFINIPGNYDLAIVGNTLYADSFVDLVTFDISDLNQIHEVKRIEGLFNHYQSMGFYNDPAKGLVTDWKMVKNVTVQENDCKSRVQTWGGIYFNEGIALTADAASRFNSKSALMPTTTGVGGSMARFTIDQDYLYALDGSYMDVVQVATEQNPIPKKEINISWDVETIFPYQKKLFVGSRIGMYIFDLSTPENPTLISQYTHLLSCDPVVVEGNYAFVTLFDGGPCHMGTNQLEVINIQDLKNPALLKTYPLKNPHGLGIDDGILFICDGEEGLKIFDAHDVNAIDQNLIAQYKDINAIDVIPYNKIAMMIAKDGLYQYDYSNLKQIRFLSKLPISMQ